MGQVINPAIVGTGDPVGARIEQLLTVEPTGTIREYKADDGATRAANALADLVEGWARIAGRPTRSRRRCSVANAATFRQA